jgi:hypothetical protein
MSIVVRYHPAGLTGETYDKVSSTVRESNWPPDGLVLHVCFGTDGDLKVSEIWDSQEQWQAHTQELMPVLQENGVEFAGEPEVFEAHRVEKGG